MKTNFIVSLCLICILTLPSKSQAQQSEKSIKQQIDVTGDSNPYIKPGEDLLGQNPANETVTASWTTLAASPNALSRSFCVYAQDAGVEYVYQFGGGAGVQLKSIARYNIGTNTWAVLGSVLNLDVSSGSAIWDGGVNIFIFGGNSATATLGSTQRYNITTGVTTTMAPMLTAVTDAAVVKRGNLVYVIGGGTGLFGAGYVNNVQVYDLTANTYTAATATSNYPVTAGMMGCGIDGNKIICAGGWNGVTGIANSYKGIINSDFDITWTEIPNYPGGGVTRMASYFVQKGTV